MTQETFEQKLQAMGGVVRIARNSQLGTDRHPLVPAEFSNWRDEQRAWRETAALFDLTHHMTDLTVQGPDALRLFSDLGLNSFKGFAPGKAKQFVCCNPHGYLIGDGILFFLAENTLSLLGLPMAHDWVQFHAKRGRYRVTLERDEPTAMNPTGRRKHYRFQVQGPNAPRVLEKLAGGSLPEIKFFNFRELSINGLKVRALRHGMSGAAGLELFGPWDDMEEMRAAILQAGAELGLVEVGLKAYLTTAIESGWIPAPVPAIFTGDDLKDYREWLPASCLEAVCSLGGSFYTEQIADYYLTPYETGYGSFVKFDHDFVGREALEAMGDQPRRRKVTLAWNTDDVLAAMGTMFKEGDPVKYIDLPFSGYSFWHYDSVLKDGKTVGLSTHPGYSLNERSMLSLAIVDANIPIGADVTLIWGEKSRGATRPVVERHRQAEMIATVSSCPYSKVARTSYAQGWRTQHE
jgi:vanillate/3-O-methylgallate O-demethylase